MTSRTVLVTGATGDTGRAVCSLLTARGDTVHRGRDRRRTAEARGCRRAAGRRPHRSRGDRRPRGRRRQRHPQLDGILHLVGGWKPGWSDEVTDWLNARLVNTLLNVSEAFEPAAARRARRTTRDRQHDGGHPRRPARDRRTRPPSSPPSRGSGSSTRGGRARSAGAVTFVVQSIGDGDKATDAVRWPRPSRRCGHRIPAPASCSERRVRSERLSRDLSARPTRRGFASDNYAGVHPEVLAAIAAANGGHQIAYGEDVYTERLRRDAARAVRRRRPRCSRSSTARARTSPR